MEQQMSYYKVMDVYGRPVQLYTRRSNRTFFWDLTLNDVTPVVYDQLFVLFNGFEISRFEFISILATFYDLLASEKY